MGSLLDPYGDPSDATETTALLDPYADPSERTIESNFFYSDLFNPMNWTEPDEFADDRGVDPFEGVANDDSYRSSRYYLSKKGKELDPRQRAALRENSLARQLAEKKDQPATIRLIRRKTIDEIKPSTGSEPMLPWDNLIPPNTKFFLEQVSESREEKVQILETFGEWVAFFYGRKPEVYSYSGTLLNAKNHDWKNEFQFNYDNFLRGSQAVKNKATMVLQYDDVMVEGYMLNCSISQSAMADKSVPFQFTLLVINRSSLNPLQALALRAVRSGLSELEDQIFQNMSAALNQVSERGATEDQETFYLMREYFAGNFSPGAVVTTFNADGQAVESSVSQNPGSSGGVADGTRESQITELTGIQSLPSIPAPPVFQP
jgi:hypothetical protein